MEEEEDGAQGNYEPRKDTNAKTDNTRVIEAEGGRGGWDGREEITCRKKEYRRTQNKERLAVRGISHEGNSCGKRENKRRLDESEGRPTRSTESSIYESSFTQISSSAGKLAFSSVFSLGIREKIFGYRCTARADIFP